VAANTGGLGFGAGVTTRVTDPDSYLRSATFTLRFLDGKAEAALGVLHDFLFSLDAGDAGRWKDVLTQARASDRTHVVNNGLGLAMAHAARGLNRETALNEIMRGLPQVRLVSKLAEGGPEPVMQKITALRNFMLDRPRLTASFTGSGPILQTVRKTLESWGQAMRDAKPADSREVAAPPSSPPRDGLAGPMDVAYCTKVLPAPHLSHPDAPLLAVGGRLVGMGYVLEEVRFKGTAYGGGCGYNGQGQSFGFYSYRDPWVKRTLDVFHGALDYVRTADWTQTDVDRAIIGTAKEAERPIRPGEATGSALWRYLSGDTPELREARHAGLLAATVSQVKRATAELFEKNQDQAGVCVVSSRTKLETANQELGAAPLAIEEIFEEQ
jgi:Zn-dependent M16 (insulinase) family peptidase